jgi:hypothetical protein
MSGVLVVKTDLPRRITGMDTAAVSGRARGALAVAALSGGAWAFVAIWLATEALSGSAGFEPAAAAAFGVCLLVLVPAVVLVGGETGGAKLAVGFSAGAALGAGVCALSLSGARGARFRGNPVAEGMRRAAAAVYGRRSPGLCDRAEARADALLACGEARSLARVLVVGGGAAQVRELLARGAAWIDVVGTGSAAGDEPGSRRGTGEQDAVVSPRVRYHDGDAFGFLRAHRGAPYDVALLCPPEPTGIAAGRLYSVEFHRLLAGRLGAMGAVVLGLPGGGGAYSQVGLGRVFATMKEAYGQAAVLPCSAKPGFATQGEAEPAGPEGRWRVLASAQGVATLDPAAAAARCSGRVMPDGGPVPAARREDFAALLDEQPALRLMNGLFNMEMAPETLGSPRLYLEYLAGRPRPTAGTAMLRLALRAPIWACFAALWAALMACGLAARATSTAGRPGRVALGTVSFLAGMVSVGGLLVGLLVFQAGGGTLSGRLAVLVALFAIGAGLGASLAARLAGLFRNAPRLALAGAGFAFLLGLLLCVGLTNLTGGSGWESLLIGAALALLGFMGGLKLTALSDLAGERGTGSAERGTANAKPAPSSAFGAPRSMGTLGAAAGAALVAGGLLPALGPATAFLILLGAELVSLGVIAAGAGRKARPGSATDEHGTPATDEHR